MPNSNFSSQIALNKAENLQFGMKNANLATPGTKFESWCAAISNEKSSCDLMLQTNDLRPEQIAFQLKIL